MIKKFNEMENNNIEMFITAIENLFFSWGGDTPPEVFWGCNDLLDWYEAEFGVNIGMRFDEGNLENWNDVIEAIRNSHRV